MDINDVIAKKRIDIQKSIETNIEQSISGEYLGDIQKAPSNPNLVLTHIIDKNGHHTVRWMSRDEAPNLEHKHVQEVKRGDVVTHAGEQHVVNLVQPNGSVYLTSPSGKKHYKKSESLQFHNPLSGEPSIATETTIPVKDTKPEQTEEQARALDYDKYGSPAERMEMWADTVDAFADNESKNLVVAYGTGGVGKTYSVLKNEKLAEELENGTAVKFTGGTTAAGFFEMLYNNKDKKIILDDFDMIFKDPSMLSLITNISRSAEERRITKPTGGSGDSEIPDAFEFTGKVMIISNVDLEDEAKSGSNSGRFEEILTNASKVDLKMSKRETWDLINEYILHKEGQVNHDLKFKNSFGEPVLSTDKDREDLASFFKENWQSTKELSGRTLAKANAIQQFYKPQGIDWKEKASNILLVEDPNKPKPEIEDRYVNFNDSVNMIADGLMKSAVIVDKNANRIVELLKSRGFKNTAINSKGYELQKQLNPNYIPAMDDEHPERSENFATEMFAVITSNMSERALYENLWKHNGKVIIFDKSAKGILNSPLGNGLLKGALDTSGDGNLAWLSKSKAGKYPVPPKVEDEDEKSYAGRLREEGFEFELDDNLKVDKKTITHAFDIPKSFDFKGRCVFITDDKNEAQQPIQSRSVIADIETTKEEFLRMADKVAEHRERLGNQFSYITKDTTPEEYRTAIQILHDNKDTIHPRKFDEEGLQEIIQMRRRSIRPDMTEADTKKMNRKIALALNKAENSIVVTNTQHVDIMKAFVSLINK